MTGREWRGMSTFAGVVGASGLALDLTFEKWIGPRPGRRIHAERVRRDLEESR